MISVLIPVYKTEKFLPQCLDSILNQTYQDLEVICVNDCSPDNSINVLREYAKKDSRIVIINKPENEGIELARLSGLQVAKGDYIAFVDSDDWLEGNGILEEMLKTAIETGSDYVTVASQRVLDKFKFIKKASSNNFGTIEKEELRNFHASFIGISLLPANMWGKLYKKECIERMEYKPLGIKMGEDLYFNMLLFPHLNRICHIDKVGYNYRFGGLTSKYNPSIYQDTMKLFPKRRQFVEDFCPEDQLRNAYWLISADLRNNLRFQVRQLIEYKVFEKQEIIEFILREIDTPVWKFAIEHLDRELYVHDPFVCSIKNKDANKIYDMSVAFVKSQRLKKTLFRFASKLLQFI